MTDFFAHESRLRQYIVAILAAVLAVLVRVLLDPLLGDNSAFVLAILAVVAAAWNGGLGPAVVCLLVSYTATVYFVLPPRQSFVVDGVANQLGTGLFVFVGLGCALLGESQRRARQAAERNYRSAVTKQVELEAEVERRKTVEEELRVQAGDLAIAQRRTADTLALFDTFVHNTPVGLAFYDTDLRYVLVNQYLANANRLPVEAHLGRPLADVPSDLPVTVESDLRAVLETGRAVVRDQVRPSRSTGEVYRAGYYPVRSADGGVIGVGAVVEDVTEKVWAEEALKASERRFRELAEALPQLVWTCRSDGACDYVSRQWEEYTGRPAGELLGSGWAGVLHSDDRDAVEAAWRAAVAAGAVFVAEFRIGRHDGGYRWFYSRAVPVYSASGLVEQWYGTNTDIHDRKETEEALRDSEANLNDFFENGPIGLHLAGPDGVILRANRAELDMLGYDRDEYVGHPVAEFHADRTVARNIRDRLARGETLRNYEARLRCKDGSLRHVLISSSVMWKDGRFVHTRSFTRDVTDRKRAEDELRESEARFRTLADSAPIMVWEAGPDRAYTYFNKAWLDFTGLTLDEELQLGWAQGVHPDDLDRGLHAYESHFVTRTAYELEYRRLRRDGEYRWLLARGTPRFTPGGGFLGFIGACVDITDRKRAEDELRASEARKAAVLESALDAIITIDRDGRVVEFNPAAERTFGYRREDAVGRNMGELIVPPAYRESHRKGMEQYLATGVGPVLNQRLELSAVRADGTEFPVEVAITAIAAGADSLFTGHIRDITDRKRAEDELRASQRWLQLLADAMPQIVWAARPDGRLDYFNERWYEFTGFDHDAPAGEGLDVVIHPDDRGPSRDAWNASVRTGRPFEVEYRFRDRRNSGYRWFLGKALPARDENGQVVRWFGSCTEIHAQKTQAETLERLVEERTAELKRSNEELEKFAYVASHDLQEPLRKVQAFGDLLRSRQGDALGGEGRDYLGRMISSAGRMRQLIQDLLEYSRVATKGQPFVPVDLDDVAAGVVSDLSVRIDQTGGTVDVGPLPTIDADPTQMRQLFQNLIGNALKFHKPDVRPVVTVRAEVIPGEEGTAGVDAPACRITVTDNGIGFEEKYLDRIFQVFQRLHGRGEYEGTGVGLALCRKIAERHGGVITARSTPGVGSTFTVTLPVRRPNP